MKTSVIFQTLRVLVFIFAIGFPSINTFAQDKSVTLVVSGEATTKGEATKQALRSAIEQAFGTFVSANTEILNDRKHSIKYNLRYDTATAATDSALESGSCCCCFPDFVNASPKTRIAVR